MRERERDRQIHRLSLSTRSAGSKQHADAFSVLLGRYVDLAIDCDGVLAVTVVCDVVAFPGPSSLRAQLASVCGSPDVGMYLGLHSTKVRSLQSACPPHPSAVPRRGCL